MSVTDSISQVPSKKLPPYEPSENGLKYKILRDPITGRRVNWLFLQFLADENQPIKARFSRRNSELFNTVTIKFQGEVVIAKHNHPGTKNPMAGYRGDRRAIEQFSPRSRMNLLQMVSKINWQATKATFITLTYHENMRDAKDAKRHLRAFCKRLYRKYGKKALLWRLEAQKRGAWHFHMFVFDAPFMPRSVLLGWWREITGDQTITQLDIRLVRNARQARNYITKYIAKQGTSLLELSTNQAACSKPGRFWGIEQRAMMVWATLIELSIPVCKAFFDLKRSARRAHRCINKVERRGFTLFTNEVNRWCNLLLNYLDCPQDDLWAISDSKGVIQW